MPTTLLDELLNRFLPKFNLEASMDPATAAQLRTAPRQDISEPLPKTPGSPSMFQASGPAIPQPPLTPTSGGIVGRPPAPAIPPINPSGNPFLGGGRPPVQVQGRPFGQPNSIGSGSRPVSPIPNYGPQQPPPPDLSSLPNVPISSIENMMGNQGLQDQLPEPSPLYSQSTIGYGDMPQGASTTPIPSQPTHGRFFNFLHKLI